MKASRQMGTWKPGTKLVINLVGVEPVPKGSMRGFVVKGRAIMTDSKSPELRALARDVRLIATREMDRLGLPCATKQPFELLAVFYLPRPGGHFGAAGLKVSSPASPFGKPDCDKLLRGAIDPLTGIVFDDDSRIVRIVTEKRFASPSRDSGLWLELRVKPSTMRELHEQQQTALAVGGVAP